MKIAKHAALILVGCACWQASAQLAFKDMKLGENILDMARKANLYCQATDYDGMAAVLCQMEFQIQVTPHKYRTVAGIPLNYLALHGPAQSGRLENIYMMFDAKDFDTVRLAYAERYPSLSCRGSAFRRAGAEYDQQICRAEADGGMIQLKKRSGSETDASVSISSGTWLKWQEATNKPKAQKGKSDL
jgi:type III secretion system FlhB-like substrate exporter